MKPEDVKTPTDLRKWLYVELRNSKDNNFTKNNIIDTLDQIMSVIHTDENAQIFVKEYMSGKEKSNDQRN